MGVLAVAAHADLITLNVATDSAIKSASPDTAFASEDRVRAQHNDIGNTYVMTYLTFDASAMGEITGIAALEAFSVANMSYPRSGGIVLITNEVYNSLDVSALTWNTSPFTTPNQFKQEAGVKIASFQVPEVLNSTVLAGNWESFGQSMLIDALNSGDRIVTLAIIREGSNDNNRFVEYASLEYNFAGTDGSHPIRLQLEVIPEPVTIGMMGVAMGALLVFRRIKMKQ